MVSFNNKKTFFSTCCTHQQLELTLLNNFSIEQINNLNIKGVFALALSRSQHQANSVSY